MSLIPSEEEFEESWRSIESPVRRAIAKVANSGETSEDYNVAGLVAGLARKRLRPIEPFGVTAAAGLGYVAISDTFFGGYDGLILVALVSGFIVYFSNRRRKLEEALAKSEVVLAAGPPPAPEPPTEPGYETEASEPLLEEGSEHDPGADGSP